MRYIGSVVSEQPPNDGHEAVIYDNLSKGHRGAVVEGARFVQGDLLEADQLRQTFKDNRIEAVNHMAASSLVGESAQEPSKYYHNNVVAGLVLLDAMRECRITRIVFSSTAATYGDLGATDPGNHSYESHEYLRRNKTRVREGDAPV